MLLGKDGLLQKKRRCINGVLGNLFLLEKSDWDKELVAECHRRPSGRTYPSVYGRMEWDDVAPTITARFDSFTRGMFGHPEQDRTISLREGAILQTFPLNCEFCGNKVDIARQIGNAVPPLMAEAIGKSIMKSVK